MIYISVNAHLTLINVYMQYLVHIFDILYHKSNKTQKSNIRLRILGYIITFEILCIISVQHLYSIVFTTNFIITRLVVTYEILICY